MLPFRLYWIAIVAEASNSTIITIFETTLRTKRIKIKIAIRTNIAGSERSVCDMPKSHFLSESDKRDVQIDSKNDIAVIKIWFGMWSSSVKKISELSMRKMVSNGEKIKLPMNEKDEIGIPQRASIGNEAAVTTSCILKKVVV